MSSSFAYLNLPLLAQLEVLRTLELGDLFAFSLINEKTKHLTTELRTSIDTLEWHFDDEGQHVLTLDDKFLLFITNDNFGSIEHNGEFKDFKLNGTTYPISLVDSDCWFIVEANKPQSHYLNVMDQFSKHILSVIRVKDFELRSEKKMDFVNLFVWKHTKTFKNAEILADELDESEAPIQIDFLFRNLTVSEFYLWLPFYNFKYTGPLTMESLNAECCDWLTLDTLLQVTCKEVHLKNTGQDKPDPAIFNALLKTWIKGDKLENLEKFTQSGYAEEDMEKILEGIETFPFAEENRPSQWNDARDLSKGMDIRRVDGTLATIWEDDGFIYFYVWHPKFLTMEIVDPFKFI